MPTITYPLHNKESSRYINWLIYKTNTCSHKTSNTHYCTWSGCQIHTHTHSTHINIVKKQHAQTTQHAYYMPTIWARHIHLTTANFI